MGDNFGLNDNYEYYEFSLDSLDADDAFNSQNLTTDWPVFTVAGKGPLTDVVALKVLEVQIPFSWYVFNSKNNTFTITETTGGTHTITIPIGNYTSSTLPAILTTALSPAVAGTTQTITCTYNTSTNNLTFTSAVNTNVFSFNFGTQVASENFSPRLFIGFNYGSITSSQVTGPVQAITSPYSVLLSGPNYLYLNSQKIGSDLDLYLPKEATNLGGGLAGPQMCKIPVNCNAGGTVIYQDSSPMMWFKYDQLQSLNGFDFYLTLGNLSAQSPLQLNGLGFSIKLGILREVKINIDRVLPTAQNGRVTRREGPKRARPAY